MHGLRLRLVLHHDVPGVDLLGGIEPLLVLFPEGLGFLLGHLDAGDEVALVLARQGLLDGFRHLAVIDYSLAAKPEGEVKIEIMDGAGNVLRTLSSASGTPRPTAATGHNRFVWDFRREGPGRGRAAGRSRWPRRAGRSAA